MWEDQDGSRRADFEVGDRSETAFLRLYEGLPEAERYCSDGYEVYGWLPSDRHEVGKGGPVNWNEGLHSRLPHRLPSHGSTLRPAFALNPSVLYFGHPIERHGQSTRQRLGRAQLRHRR